MDSYFFSYSGGFQNDHGLHDDWGGDAQLLANIPHSIGVGERLEDRIGFVEIMAYFVDSLPLGDSQSAVFPSQSFIEEAGLLRGFQEVLTYLLLLSIFGATENRNLLLSRLIVVNKPINLANGHLALLGGGETRNDRIAVLL